jgi:effector-binding domain-containing protein
LVIYLGFYKPVDISVERRGPLHLLFKSHNGAYHEIGPTIREIEDWAMNHHLACDKTFGEYLDDPEVMDQDRLRSRGGCILNSEPPILPANFQYEERPRLIYVVGRFSGSPAIGPMKVYPKIKRYIAEHHLKATGAVIETYKIDGQNVETEYLFPLDVPASKLEH